MHIAFITPEFPHTHFQGNIGGIGTFTKNIAKQLIRLNHTVTIFVHSQAKEFVLKENRVTIHFVKLKKVKGITWITNRRYFNQYVNKVIKKDNIEVIEAPEWTGFTAFMKFDCPLIVRLHGSDTYFCHLENRKAKAKNQFFEKKALKGANAIVGVSKFVADKTKELFGLTQEIITIYNTIDVTDFVPNHQYIKPKTLLYFGTIVRKKGVLEIAKAFNKIVAQDKKVQLCFVGRDNRDVFTGKSTLKMVEELLSTNALKNFKHINAVPYTKVKKIINNAEVVLLPSFAEAFPMTWLESMALEKRLITSNIGWAKELMIDGDTGFMVNPKNTEEFSLRILNLLEDEANAKTMAINARKRIISNFNMDNIIIQNIKLYKSVL
ncbi:glycosyltransferase family 4 protein [Polaribacter septentrionalilitoris]|uniref:glycosyltransferase family 4 protein n=1 Tax=Polaribacter septentrionalilitoris TaxID=2494657 RepID=UPI00135B9788|nr:glycosyltransferase family 4 protein [Polaribacter septentrionalilitoris]